MLGRIEHLFLWFVLLTPIKVCSQIDTITVFFDTDKSNLIKAQGVYIDSFFSLVSTDLVQAVELIGQADHRGSLSYNLELSQQRAYSVAIYILNNYPIAVNKILQKGIGEQENLSNLSDSRRVDIIITREEAVVRLEEVFTPGSIKVEALSLGNILKIKGLNFHPGRSVLLPKSIPHLKDLEKLLVQYPNLEIEIQGHVCCPDQQKKGKDGFNLDTQVNNLSTARAKNIYNYLVRKGISAKRLRYDGFGASIPIIYPEESESDRIQNRRVELLITKL